MQVVSTPLSVAEQAGLVQVALWTKSCPSRAIPRFDAEEHLGNVLGALIEKRLVELLQEPDGESIGLSEARNLVVFVMRVEDRILESELLRVFPRSAACIQALKQNGMLRATGLRRD